MYMLGIVDVQFSDLCYIFVPSYFILYFYGNSCVSLVIISLMSMPSYRSSFNQHTNILVSKTPFGSPTHIYFFSLRFRLSFITFDIPLVAFWSCTPNTLYLVQLIISKLQAVNIFVDHVICPNIT